MPHSALLLQHTCHNINLTTSGPTYFVLWHQPVRWPCGVVGAMSACQRRMPVRIDDPSFSRTRTKPPAIFLQLLLLPGATLRALQTCRMLETACAWTQPIQT